MDKLMYYALSAKEYIQIWMNSDYIYEFIKLVDLLAY